MANGISIPGIWSQPGQTSNGYLPFSNEHAAGVGTYNDLLNRTQGMGVPGFDLDTARNRARQEAASRGIQGPLAAQFAVDAQNSVIDQFGQRRDAQLMELLDRRSALIDRLQQGEMMRRQMAAQRRAQEVAQQSSLYGTIGGIGGGLIGAYFGNPMLGYTVGSAGGQMLGQQAGNWGWY